MKLIVRHLFRDLGDYYITNFFNSLYSALQERFQDYSFEVINYPEYEDNGYGSIYSCMHFSIINPTNNKYIVVSFFDNWRYLFMKHLGWNPKLMTQFFYCGGFNYLEYYYWKNLQKDNTDVYMPTNIDKIYHSFSYNPYNTNYDKDIDNIYNKYDIQKSIPKLYFRGYMWDFRKQMVDTIKDESIVIIDKNENNNNLNYIDYLQDLSKYRAALSLPGGTEVCNRDIECFSVGVPVIRPLLSTTYPDPLIANYHYISCYDSCKYWDGGATYNNYIECANCVTDTWHRIKNDTEYLNFISNNARCWYLKNCGISNNIDYLLSHLDLESLYG